MHRTVLVRRRRRRFHFEDLLFLELSLGPADVFVRVHGMLRGHDRLQDAKAGLALFLQISKREPDRRCLDYQSRLPCCCC